MSSNIGGNLGVIVAGGIGAGLGSGSAKLQRSIGTNSKGQPIVAQITVEEKHTDELVITDHPVEFGCAITDHAYMMPFEVTIRCMWSNSPPGSGGAGPLNAVGSALTSFLSGTVQNQITGAASNAIGGSAIGNLAVAQLSDQLGALFTTAQVNTETGANTSTVQDIYQTLQTLQQSRVPVDIYTGKRKYSSMLIKSMTVQTDVKTENALEVLLVCRQAIIVNTMTVTLPTDAALHQDASSTVAPVQNGSKQVVDTTVTDNINDAILQLRSGQATAISLTPAP